MILKIAIPTPLRTSFDYLLPSEYDKEQLQPGMRVSAPFGARDVVGVLLGISNKSTYPIDKIKPIHKILDLTAIIPEKLLQLAQWASDYYHHPIGEVMANVLPKELRLGKDIAKYLDLPRVSRRGGSLCPPVSVPENVPTLNAAQQTAVSAITATDKFQVFLLDGVTGSGKTEVYLRVIADVISQGKQALVLIPEIGLTPQTVARFQQRFSVPIAISHSRLTPKQRAQTWLQAKAGQAAIIIGTRSSIFTPLQNPGVIILDEEHDLSFKQQAGFRYSARDLAVVRGKLEDIPVILGSATPSLESINNCNRGRYIPLHLPERAGIAIHPTFHVVDIRNQKLRSGLSSQLRQEIRQQLAQGNQILLFLNRRGYAPTLLCHSCGWVAECRNCDARLTLHQNPPYLHCHHCDATRPLLKNCPQCGSDKLISVGAGTERLEEGLAKEFPEVAILRIDRDTTSRKGSMEKMLTEVHNNNYQILVGTQMIAKGHHFPNVTIAAILDADSGLLSADFRASEQVTQLITQVAGRAGRAEKLGKVFVQTHNPTHPLLLTLIKEGYQKVAQEILLERKNALLPPLTNFALLRAEAKQQTDAFKFLTELKNLGIDGSNTQVQILGPIPAPMQRKAKLYRAQLLLSSMDRGSLHNVLNSIANQLEQLKRKHRIRCSLDIDPMDMY